MKRFNIAVLFLICVTVAAAAQNLAVKSFALLETDVTANIQGTTVIDQNGEKCALIKIITTATGFSFDVGTLGVQKVDQHTGEIWVYMPHGVKRITINHQQLGFCEYFFPIPIDAARTYRMELIAGEVQTIVKHAVTSQYVVFRVSPDNATIELDGQVLQAHEGGATKRMPFGTYDYRVAAPRYYPQIGSVTVNNPQQKHIVNINLEPAFATVAMTVDAEAEIWIDDVKRGVRSFTGELAYGTYLVECRQAGHRPSQKEITLTADNARQPITLPRPTPIYGSLDINSIPVDAEIWIDGKRVGESPLFIQDLLVGRHNIRLTKAGHSDYVSTITIEEGQTTQVNAQLENGREVEIVTQEGATIYVDGQAVGTTRYKGNLTFGNHTAYATLNGKRTSEETLNVSQSGNAMPTLQLPFTNNRTFTVKGVQFTMVAVAGGRFNMGATSEQGSDAFNNEKPTHLVTLNSYFIGQTEVTQALWKAVMASNPSYYKGDNRPVEKVSWNDCQTFIRKLNQLTGQQFRLPTEAEWEYAARGGKESRGYKYSGSNNINDVAWYIDNSRSTTHDVGTKAPNELGLFDMSGNVWEWCSDWFGNYPRTSQTNPTGPSYGSYRVSRGGGWSFNARGCRVSNRDYYTPGFSNGYLGLRLVLPQ